MAETCLIGAEGDHNLYSTTTGRLAGTPGTCMSGCDLLAAHLGMALTAASCRGMHGWGGIRHLWRVVRMWANCPSLL